MDGAVFGSYSLTEFVDLYELNLRNNHHYALFFEVDSHGIVKFKSDKIDGFKKNFQGSYLIGILTPTLDMLTIETKSLSYFDSPYDFDIDTLCEKKKAFFYITYEESKIKIATVKHTIAVSNNGSFSAVEPHGYNIIRPNYTYSIPIFHENVFITGERNMDDGHKQELYKE